MRKAVEFLFTRVLRSRIGVALGLAVVVLGIVGAARLYAGPTDPVVRARPPAPIATVDPEAGDDGVIDAESTPTPSTSPGAAAPGTVAKAFATAWLLHRGSRPSSGTPLWRRIRPRRCPRSSPAWIRQAYRPTR
ncbi:hypothetical protein GCM10027605_04900 [Micromonospora zhanjiangensis]